MSLLTGVYFGLDPTPAVGSIPSGQLDNGKYSNVPKVISETLLTGIKIGSGSTNVIMRCNLSAASPEFIMTQMPQPEGKPLTGRTAVVTGASRGIGRANRPEVGWRWGKRRSVVEKLSPACHTERRNRIAWNKLFRRVLQCDRNRASGEFSPSRGRNPRSDNDLGQ